MFNAFNVHYAKNQFNTSFYKSIANIERRFDLITIYNIKNMKLLSFCLLLIGMVSFSACNQGPACPAYNSVHNSKDYGYNPNNAERAKENNKADIAAKKKAALSPKSAKRGRTSLFPKGMVK
jgi:hypothetical protein